MRNVRHMKASLRYSLGCIVVLALMTAAFIFGNRHGLATAERDHYFDFVTIEGICVNGEITTIRPSDIALLKKAVAQIADNKYPIMSIKVIDKDLVDVQVGQVRGPLNGGGRYYKLRRSGNGWDLVPERMKRSWIS